MTAGTPAPLGRQVARGAMLMVALRMAFRMIGLVSTLILVRLLQPSDFGLVGLATAAYAIIELLSELSFQLALVRMGNPQRSHYDTAWTMGVLRGIGLALCLVALAPVLAEFVGDERVVPLSLVLAVIALVQGFENVGLVDFQRELRFDRIFWYQLAGKAAGFVVAVPAALLLRNYWALIAGIAAARLVLVPLGYAMHPYRPRLSLAAFGELFSFSKWLLITNVQWVIDANIMTFLVGRVAGSAAIGLYQVANQIASLPASEIAAPIRSPIYAGYARVADDLPKLRKQVLDGFFLLIAVLLPISLGIALTAAPLTTLFLGEKWLAAIPLMQFCALTALFDAVGHFSHNVYTVLHRQRSFVAIFTVALAIRVPSLVVAGYLAGVNGAACAMALTAALNMVLWNARIFPVLGVGLADIVAGTWRTLCAGAVMAVAVTWVLVAWPEPAGVSLSFIRFFVVCFGGAVIHVAVQLGAWRLAGAPAGAEAELLQMARHGVERLVPSIGAAGPM